MAHISTILLLAWLSHVTGIHMTCPRQVYGEDILIHSNDWCRVCPLHGHSGSSSSSIGTPCHAPVPGVPETRSYAVSLYNPISGRTEGAFSIRLEQPYIHIAGIAAGGIKLLNVKLVTNSSQRLETSVLPEDLLASEVIYGRMTNNKKLSSLSNDAVHTDRLVYCIVSAILEEQNVLLYGHAYKSVYAHIVSVTGELLGIVTLNLVRGNTLNVAAMLRHGNVQSLHLIGPSATSATSHAHPLVMARGVSHSMDDRRRVFTGEIILDSASLILYLWAGLIHVSINKDHAQEHVAQLSRLEEWHCEDEDHIACMNIIRFAASTEPWKHISGFAVIVVDAALGHVVDMSVIIHNTGEDKRIDSVSLTHDGTHILTIPGPEFSITESVAMSTIAKTSALLDPGVKHALENGGMELNILLAQTQMGVPNTISINTRVPKIKVS